MGTGRLVVDSPIVWLEEFLFHIGIRDTCDMGVQEYVFDKALMISGWRHCWDLILQDALLPMEWFASWLADLKVRLTRNVPGWSTAARTSGIIMLHRDDAS